jgi:hypothetical protein
VQATSKAAIDRQEVRVSTTPIRAAIARDQRKDDFEVLVTVEAPKVVAPEKRAPIDLVAVLDVSGSMNKEGKAHVVEAGSSQDRHQVHHQVGSRRRPAGHRVLQPRGRQRVRADKKFSGQPEEAGKFGRQAQGQRQYRFQTCLEEGSGGACVRKI